MQRQQDSRLNIKTYQDAAGWADKFARQHRQMERTVAQYSSDNYERNRLYRNAEVFHRSMCSELSSLHECLSRFLRHHCYKENEPAGWDVTFEQLFFFKESFQYWHEYSDFREMFSRLVETETQFINDLLELEQWLVRPTITPFDGTKLCPANVDVDDVFYDCPVGSDEMVSRQSIVHQEDGFLCVDPHTGRPAISFQALSQTIKSHAIHGATATFIIEMVGYFAKRQGLSDRAINVVTTTTGFAIAFYTGSFLSSVAYTGSKQLALYSGLSEKNAGRVALTTETGVRVARNLTLPGLIETSTSMAATYAGSLAGSAMSFFAQSALNIAFKPQPLEREYALSEVAVDKLLSI
jgi:hypothetical protein